MVTESNGISAPPQELETFLPQDGKKKEFIGKAKTADLESAEYDPFKERKLEHPTSDMDTLMHLLKASLGTGILSMPKAFQSVGLVGGIVLTIFVAFICTHCSYILVKASHILYKKTRRTTMSFPETAKVAFENGPQCLRKYANAFRILILTSLFVTYFGTCSVYTVIIGQSIMQVVLGEEGPIRLYILMLWIPLVLLGLIRNLKHLAPVSMVANVFMGISLCVTMYYLTTELTEFHERKYFQNISMWPQFFSITIFAMEAIGVVMPLENAMRTPQNMLGICGVMSRGMSGVTLVYILLGFLGYACYGDKVMDIIVLNLDINQIPAKVVKILIAIAVFCTFSLQFYVCVEIGWNGIKDRYTKHPVAAELIMRSVLISLCVGLAVAIPSISPFISFIGSFCFSILGLMIPAVIEVIAQWDDGFGKYNWVIWKNVFIGIFSLAALSFGTKDSIEKIIVVFS